MRGEYQREPWISVFLCRTRQWVTALFILALLTGCASTGLNRTAATDIEHNLFAWVESELGPYLVDQLSRQPRFKGEPVLLVSMHGADIRPEIDALSAGIRSKLLDQLLRAPGTEMLWRPSNQPWDHHRGRKDLRCTTASSARYFIGIDIIPLTSDRYRISARALDVDTASWVSGFGKNWQGELTRQQRQALASRSHDEYLRGLRVLPFQADQTDLVAAYLAQNLSCVLRAQGSGIRRVFVDSRVEKETDSNTIMKLVGHNLAGQQALSVTENRNDADLVLRGSLSKIHGDLYQFWIKVHNNASDNQSLSAATDAYFHLSKRAAAQVVERHQHPGHGRLLSGLRVLRNPDKSGCDDRRYHPMKPKDPVAPGDCFLVEFDLYQSANLFFINHTVDGRLALLPEDSCQKGSNRLRWQSAGNNLRLSHRRNGRFRWAGKAGMESIYAIAVSDRGRSRELSKLFNELPRDCTLSDNTRWNEYDSGRWLARLDRLLQRHGNSAEWQAVRIRHRGV